MGRFLFILTAFYFVFIGSPYYYPVFALRVFHHAFVTVILLAWLWTKRRRGLPVTPLNAWAYAAIVLWIVTSVVSLDPRMAFEHLWFPLVHWMLFFVFVDLIRTGRQRLLIETQFLIAALVVIVAGGQFASWFFGLNLTPGTDIGWIDVLGDGITFPMNSPMLYLPLGVSTWLAAYTTPLIFLSAGWALTTPRRDFRVVLWGLTAGLFGVLLLTGSRGGLIALAVGVGVISLLRFTQELRRRRALLVLFPVGVFAIVGGIVLTQSGAIARATGDALRFNLWNSAVEIVRDTPLTGVGVGLFGRAVRSYRDPLWVDNRLGTAHNVVLNTAAETGLIGAMILAGMAITVGVLIWRRWRRLASGERLRLEFAAAGLAGLSVQSLFDTFTLTPIVALVALLVAYCIVEPGSRLDPPQVGHRWAIWAAAALVIAFGVGFIQSDRAQFYFNRSVRTESLADAQTAAQIDPHLRLYALQIAYLQAQTDDIDAAAAAYERAVALEPTWETGLLNLAALEEQRGDIPAALVTLDRARALNTLNPATLHWARLADEWNAALEETILDRYLIGMGYRPPESSFWLQTERRRAAVERYFAPGYAPVDWQYRAAAALIPDRVGEFVSDSLLTDAQWWTVAESTRTLGADPQTAAETFTEAVRLAPRNGDHYVSRARALAAFDPISASRDLDLAQLLGTYLEYPGVVRVELAQSDAEREALRLVAVPARVIDQNFEGVLFGGRVASFEILSAMRLPLYSDAVLQPWRDLAGQYRREDDPRAALVEAALREMEPWNVP